MELKDDGMLGKLKTTFSIIYGILLWVARLSSTVKVPPHYYLGAVLSASPQLQKNDYRKKYHLDDELPSQPPSPSCLSSSSSFSLSSTGDIIGSESGVYLSSSEDALLAEQGMLNLNSNSFYQKKKVVEKKIGKKEDFPPPLTSLISSKNRTCQVPWALDKYYVDGRMIVKEKWPKHLEYLETYRENGRLVMKLVPFDDTFEWCHSDYESVNFDITEKDDTCDHFSSNVEGEGNYEDQKIPVDEMEYQNLELSIGKKCNKEGDKSLLNRSFFSVCPSMNKPIHV